MNLEPNVAAALAYVFGWLSGLVVYLMEKENKFVRFHAVQSIMIGLAFTVVYLLVVAIEPGLSIVLWLGGLAIWVLLLVKAYQGEWFEVPVVADLAHDQLRRPGAPIDGRPQDGAGPQEQWAPPSDQGYPPDGGPTDRPPEGASNERQWEPRQ